MCLYTLNLILQGLRSVTTIIHFTCREQKAINETAKEQIAEEYVKEHIKKVLRNVCSMVYRYGILINFGFDSPLLLSLFKK